MNGGRVAVLGFPTDSNSSFLRGAARAPALIRQAVWSEGGNPFTESGLDLSAAGVIHDVGDIALTESEADRSAIEHSVAEQLRAGRRVLSLGGDHSIAYPIVRAYSRQYPDLSIVQFDAHPDLYPVFAGNRFSHACPFARILDELPIRRLVQIGIRTMSPPQREVAQRYGVAVFGPSALEPARAALPSGDVYVSLDLDGLDPAYAPGVSHREPGGLSVRDVIELVEAIPGKVVGADVVELNPDEDVRGLTAAVAAKLARELIARIFRDAS